MSKQFIITATGTDVGKTLTSAILMLGLDADYWKPIQCGEDTDTKTMRALTALPAYRFHPESYCFKTAASPHIAAEHEGATIDINLLKPPQTAHPLLIEGAGGLMVPVTRDTLMIDVFQRLHAPVILCARTELGTINHTLLSIEALQKRNIPLHGIIFLGPENKDTVQTILDFSKARLLGHIPLLDTFSDADLHQIFNLHFRKSDFLA
ncbi:MAG: dethiobiotin synthase [Alphaproteobacteria bacterium]|nr:dethiobiotin synthase [Alphaproteobacteria bacterium]